LLESVAGYILLIEITLFPSCIYYLRTLGTVHVYSLFLNVWFSDTFAYIVGNLIGGTKIWSEISPKKTISGTIGGILAGSCIGYLMGKSFLESLLVSSACQIGDLIESYAKRKVQIKDSDVLICIPGHGGILDRIDGLLLSTPIAVLCKIFF